MGVPSPILVVGYCIVPDTPTNVPNYAGMFHDNRSQPEVPTYACGSLHLLPLTIYHSQDDAINNPPILRVAGGFEVNTAHIATHNGLFMVDTYPLDFLNIYDGSLTLRSSVRHYAFTTSTYWWIRRLSIKSSWYFYRLY